MENIVLNELLEKANKDGKKTDLSKTDQNTYRNEYSQLLSQNGIDDDVVMYFVKGIKCSTAYVTCVWINKFPFDKQYSAYKSIVDSSVFSDLDSVSQFRIVLAWTAAFWAIKEQNDEIVSDLLYRFVSLSKKKDGKRLSELSKLFKTYFMDNMRHQMFLPRFVKYHFSEEYEKELVLMLREAVEGIQAKGDLEIDRLHALRDWVKVNSEGYPEESQEVQATTNVDSEEKNNNKSSITTDSEVSGGALSKKLLELAKAVAVFENENKDVYKVIEEKDKEISRLKSSINKYQETNKTFLDENTKLKQEICDLLTQKETLLSENKGLAERIGRQSEVIDVFDQDKDNSKNELLNQIATSLKKIYTDYKAAENMEMSIDLGMNMRDSLDDVFRKLKKMGIDIEGRQ